MEAVRQSNDAAAVLERQLERMRSMQFGYYDQFFRFVNLNIVALLALVVVSLHSDFRLAALIAPFYLLYIGMHSAYLYSYIIFARTYALALEQALNRQFGAPILVAHELEAAYLFPLAPRRFVAFSGRNPGSFLSAETLQFAVGGGVLFAVVAVWAIRVAGDQEDPWGPIYSAGLGLWSVLNLGYLVWYYFISDYEKRLRSILEARYGTDFGDARHADTV